MEKPKMVVDKGAEGMVLEDIEFKTNTDGIRIGSNSYKSRQAAADYDPAEKKTFEKVIKGNVVSKKKPLGRKMAEVFTGDDIKSVGQYVLFDVLIPAAKSTFSDMVSTGIDMLLFGEANRSRSHRSGGKSFVNYSKVSLGQNLKSSARNLPPKSRARHDFNDIILESRGEAEEVLSHLVDIIDEYDRVSIADFYELVGVKFDYTDRRYGWTNLASASVSRVRDGYLINLPRAGELD